MKELIKIKTMEPKNKLRIEFAIGNYCNFNCSYCGSDYNGGTHRWTNNEDLLLKNFKHLLNFYIDNKINYFEINVLGGEPSLWPGLVNFVKEIKKNYNTKMTMTTNGSRTIRWWEKNSTAFDKILFSYHQGQTDIDHFIKVLDLVYSNGTAVNVLMMMNSSCWEECVESIEKMKTNSKHPWFISAMEINPPTYTATQLEFFKKHVKRCPPIFRIIKDEYKNILKGNPTVIYSDNSSKKIPRNWLSINELNNFQGWMCNLGIETINIKKEGTITGMCNNSVYGAEQFYNIYDSNFVNNFSPILQPTVCEKSKCWCQPEILMTKWKI